MMFLRIDLALAFRSAREAVLAVIMESPRRPGVVPTLLVHLLLRIRRWEERDRGRPGSFSGVVSDPGVPKTPPRALFLLPGPVRGGGSVPRSSLGIKPRVESSEPGAGGVLRC